MSLLDPRRRRSTKAAFGQNFRASVGRRLPNAQPRHCEPGQITRSQQHCSVTHNTRQTDVGWQSRRATNKRNAKQFVRIFVTISKASKFSLSSFVPICASSSTSFVRFSLLLGTFLLHGLQFLHVYFLLLILRPRRNFCAYCRGAAQYVLVRWRPCWIQSCPLENVPPQAHRWVEQKNTSVLRHLNAPSMRTCPSKPSL